MITCNKKDCLYNGAGLIKTETGYHTQTVLFASISITLHYIIYITHILMNTAVNVNKA